VPVTKELPLLFPRLESLNEKGKGEFLKGGKSFGHSFSESGEPLWCSMRKGAV